MTQAPIWSEDELNFLRSLPALTKNEMFDAYKRRFLSFRSAHGFKHAIKKHKIPYRKLRTNVGQLAEPYSEEMRNGYIRVRVPDPGGKRPYKLVQKHRLIWEAKFGPIPDGYGMRCRSQNRSDTDTSNWVVAPDSVIRAMQSIPFDRLTREEQDALIAHATLKFKLAMRGIFSRKSYVGGNFTNYDGLKRKRLRAC